MIPLHNSVHWSSYSPTALCDQATGLSHLSIHISDMVLGTWKTLTKRRKDSPTSCTTYSLRRQGRMNTNTAESKKRQKNESENYSTTFKKNQIEQSAYLNF